MIRGACSFRGTGEIGILSVAVPPFRHARVFLRSNQKFSVVDLGLRLSVIDNVDLIREIYVFSYIGVYINPLVKRFIRVS